MEKVTLAFASSDDLSPEVAAFYSTVLHALNDADAPFLVGGAYAFNRYTGINRPTKDLDLFIDRKDYDHIAQIVSLAGFEIDLTYPHWLAKVHSDDVFIDVIFSSGNGIAEVDALWFDHAPIEDVLGVPVRICPPEEMIWSKAFIMERERYDGADIAHLLRAISPDLDWRRLLMRFGTHWRVLLSHITLFGYVYPAHRGLVPPWVMNDLIERLREETLAIPKPDDLCQGTLLSREQYLIDIEQFGYKDSRLIPHGNMTKEDTAHWTAAIAESHEQIGKH